MGQLDTTPTTSSIPAHGPVVFPAPPGGWSREAYSDAIKAFTDARGRVPRTITMHPHTLAAVTRMFVRREVEKVVDGMVAVVHREEQLLERVQDALQPAEPDAVTIVTSDQHDRATIVMT